MFKTWRSLVRRTLGTPRRLLVLHRCSGHFGKFRVQTENHPVIRCSIPTSGSYRPSANILRACRKAETKVILVCLHGLYASVFNDFGTGFLVHDAVSFLRSTCMLDFNELFTPVRTTKKREFAIWSLFSRQGNPVMIPDSHRMPWHNSRVKFFVYEPFIRLGPVTLVHHYC